jgi:hypothetical protein
LTVNWKRISRDKNKEVSSKEGRKKLGLKKDDSRRKENDRMD